MSTAEDRASIHNFVGVELARLAGEAPELDGASLYAQASAEFRAATNARPSWYLPYENLADVTSYLGELEKDPRRQFEAMELYDRARARAARPDGYLSGDRTMELMRAILAELTVSRAISRLMSGSPDAFEAGLDDIDSVAQGDTWDPALERSAEVLYTVACFFSRASSALTRTASARSRAMALRCLSFAFAASPELIAEAIGDPDLRPIEELSDLIRSVDWGAVAMPDTPEREATVDTVGDRAPGGV